MCADIKSEEDHITLHLADQIHVLRFRFHGHRIWPSTPSWTGNIFRNWMRGLRQRLVAGQARFNMALSCQINLLAVGLLMTPTRSTIMARYVHSPLPTANMVGGCFARNTVPWPPIVGAPILHPPMNVHLGWRDMPLRVLFLSGFFMEEMGTVCCRGHSIVSYSVDACC